MSNEHLLELIDILAKRAQDGGMDMADCAESPLMKLRAKILAEQGKGGRLQCQ